jgi:hypothetical protein
MFHFGWIATQNFFLGIPPHVGSMPLKEQQVMGDPLPERVFVL